MLRVLRWGFPFGPLLTVAVLVALRPDLPPPSVIWQIALAASAGLLLLAALLRRWPRAGVVVGALLSLGASGGMFVLTGIAMVWGAPTVADTNPHSLLQEYSGDEPLQRFDGKRDLKVVVPASTD